MNSFHKLLLSFLLLAATMSAESISSFTFDELDQGWNSDELVKTYFHHSEMQRQWAWEALSKLTFTGHEKILDFGCGDGKISAEMARLCKNGEVLGLDVSEKMIHTANTYFHGYAFPNLTFKASKSLTLSDFPGSQDADLVCAFTVFHLISNPVEVLKNLKMHLKPSGKLLLVIPTGKNKAFRQAADETFPKYGLEAPWNQGRGPNGPTMRTLDGCASLLEEAGFLVESLEIIDTDNLFYDVEDFITWCVGTSTATWRIPFSMSRSFFSDLVHRTIEIDPSSVDDDGHFNYAMPRIHASATPR